MFHTSRGPLVFIVAALFFSNIVSAQELSLISEGKLIEDKSSCRIVESKKPSFFILNQSVINKTSWFGSYGDYLYGGEMQPVSMNKGSMLFVHKNQRQDIGKRTDVLVMLAKPSLEKNKGGAVGEVLGHFIDSPEKWSIEVIESQIINESLMGGRNFFDGKILKAAKEEDSFLSLKCCKANTCRSFTVFDVHRKGKSDPFHRLAFRPNDDQFLISMHGKKEQVNSVFENPIKRVTAPTRRPSPQSSKTPVIQVSSTQQVSQGPYEKMICTKSGNLNIRDQDLKKVIFKAKRFSNIKTFQGWGTNQKNKKIRGKNYKFVKVQFVEKQGKTSIGWVAENYVKLRSNCKYFKENKTKAPGAGSLSNQGPQQVTTPTVSTAKGPFLFPLLSKPVRSYKNGGRQFGASRRGGRKHAACDLRRPAGDNIVAISAGKVLRKYYFYKGTDALEVKHSNGYVVRYGEVSKRNITGIRSGASVQRGQKIARVGQLSGGSSMLHFEMYKGSASGPLTRRGSAYKRRSDLINPTSYLNKWIKQLL